LKEYLEETMSIFKNRGWYPEAGNSSRYLQIIYSLMPQNRDFIISLNKAVAGAKKVVEKYEAGTLVSGEAARAQMQVDQGCCKNASRRVRKFINLLNEPGSDIDFLIKS